LELNFFF